MNSRDPAAPLLPIPFDLCDAIAWECAKESGKSYEETANLFGYTVVGKRTFDHIGEVLAKFAKEKK